MEEIHKHVQMDWNVREDGQNGQINAQVIIPKMTL